MPLGKDEPSKLAASTFFADLLNAIKDADIPKYLDGMSEDERVHCLKWVYRAMATGKNCTALLKWQAAITDKDGVGSIMRVIVDRKL